MKLFRWLESGTIYFVIMAALVAGLAASYGRELEEKRRPDRSWWVRRVLLIPLLAIAATAATDAFALSASTAAFAAAMLSLGGYDALRLIETRWRARLRGLADNPEPRTDGGSDELLPRS